MNKFVYIIGVDIGTGGCKVTILRNDGVIVSDAEREYHTSCPKNGWAEQNPDEWYKAVSACIKEAIAKASIKSKSILAVCANGQPHTLVLMDSSDKIIRPAILWNDQRSFEQSEKLKFYYGDLFMRVGFNEINPTWTISMLRWVKEKEPESWNRIYRIMLPKDYLRFRLTGEWMTDWTDAAGTLLIDAEKKEWSYDLCDCIELPIHLLPKIVSPLDIAGNITKKAADETGLCEGTPVVTGACDPAAELLGAGLIKKNCMMFKLATAGVIFYTSEKPHPHPKTLTYPHVLPGIWFTLTGTNACCYSIRWFRDIFFCEEAKIAVSINKSPYEFMDAEAEKVNPGSDGLIYHPYLMGERSPYFDPNLRGSFTGIRPLHEKRHFVRAIFEGVAFSLRDCFDLIRSFMEEPEEDAILIGGGAKSKVWPQILSDILCLPLKKLDVVDASIGSAIIGGLGASIFESPEKALKICRRRTSTLYPNRENCFLYNKRYLIYKKIHDLLASVYREW